MAIDNIIAAGIQPTTPIMSPMQSIGGLMQLRGQMADQSLREAQMAEVRQRQQNEKLRGEQINLDLKDANNFAEIQKDAGLMRKFGETGDVSMFHQKGISPAFIDKLVEGRGKRITGMQAETVTGQAIKKNATEQMIATGDGIMAPMAGGKPVDIATANSRYTGALPRLKELALLRGDDPAKLPGSITSLEQIQGVLSGLNLDAGLYDAGLKRTEETAKRDKAVAQAEIESKKNVGTDAQGLTSKDRAEIDQHNAAIANARAQLPKIEADAVIARLEKDFMAAHGGLKPSEVESRRHNMADELRAAADAGGDKLLTVAEAATLGVPYGTTREQAKGKSPTKESQQVTANYASRIKQSNDQLNGIEDQFADQWALTNWAADKMWNSLKSNDRQAMDQSKRNFINSVLRRESGAVITDPEFANANQQYFVQPGDGKKVIEQKRQNRNLVQRNFIKASGNAYEDPPAANAAHKVGDTVQIGDKRIKISEIHADGTFDGDEVK